MRNKRIVLVLCVTSFLWAGALALSPQEAIQSPASESEKTVWNLERAYWRHVQNNDLPAYLGLWHKNSLAWPAPNAVPAHKDNITDWITLQTSKGLAFKTVEFKPAAIQMTGDVAVTCYWVTYQWLDKDGHGATQTSRVTHTWLRDGKDWRVIAGMSMPVPGASSK